MKKRRTLRADTTLAPAGEVEREIYVQALPACCLRSFKRAALASAEERRQLALGCSCGRNWWITSSLDERVLERFVTHGGPRVGSGADHGPSAA
ncbi:MAG: hypothetical protein ACR2HO_10720 [Rubrobacteraceae bacterium]